MANKCGGAGDNDKGARGNSKSTGGERQNMSFHWAKRESGVGRAELAARASMMERKAMLRRTLAVFGDVMAGRDYNMELLLEFYQHLALNIKSEKDRIGGDFAVATVLMNRRVRDHVR